MTKRFQILDTGGKTIFGKHLFANGSTIEPGLIVQLDSSGSTVSLCDSGDTPFGIAYGERWAVYAPTSRIFADAEALSVAKGHYTALISSDFFSSGSLPTTPQTVLYTADNGLIGTSSSGTTKVGRYLRTETLYQPVGGTGSTQSLAMVEFNFLV